MQIIIIGVIKIPLFHFADFKIFRNRLKLNKKDQKLALLLMMKRKHEDLNNYLHFPKRVLIRNQDTIDVANYNK